MQAQAYEGYFENGNFYAAGQAIRIPEHKRVCIMVFDEPVQKTNEVANSAVRPPFEYECMSEKIWISNDFDAPLDDFKEYME